ncbi:G-protein coupled receptor 171 [Engraulis encrasicolus]|uniref:G-protein coupled receptor 171 n=1 Tax=Engraulis encrasicolus TaxID=184585 RepID=UPI002FD1FB92
MATTSSFRPSSSNTSSSSSSSSSCVISSPMEPFAAAYILIFLLGTAGALLSLWAFVRAHATARATQKCMNVYLINLLVADLLLMLALPFKIATDLVGMGAKVTGTGINSAMDANTNMSLGGGTKVMDTDANSGGGGAGVSLGIFHCQCTAVLIYINMYASITFLAFVCMSRYLQLHGGRGSRSLALLHLQEPRFAALMAAVVWLLVLFINVPNMAIPIRDDWHHTDRGRDLPTYGMGTQGAGSGGERGRGPPASFKCADLKTELGQHWHLLSVFLGMMIFLNASAILLLSNGLVLKQLWGRRHAEREHRSSARKASVSIAGVTLAYVLCFVPYHAVRMPYAFTQTRIIEDCALHRSLFLAKESTLLLAILHLLLHPVLYFYLSSSVRGRLTSVFSSMRSRQEEGKDGGKEEEEREDWVKEEEEGNMEGKVKDEERKMEVVAEEEEEEEEEVGSVEVKL